jgi:L-lactate dehydrogenase complex protein LldG
MSARDEVLARIRVALGEPRSAAEPVLRGYRARTALSRGELAELFTDRLADYGAIVRRCGQPELSATVAAALAERGARAVIVPEGLDVPVPAEVEQVRGDGMTAAELDAVDGVITRAALAIAETGTIILDGAPGQGRRALSLIPDYHLCVLRSGQIVGLVPEALARLDPRRPLTWISGPSATSDIELERVQGVHGPRTLEVILVSAEEGLGG